MTSSLRTRSRSEGVRSWRSLSTSGLRSVATTLSPLARAMSVRTLPKPEEEPVTAICGTGRQYGTQNMWRNELTEYDPAGSLLSRHSV